MNRETRLIRPFRDIGLHRILDHLTLRFGSDHCQSGKSIIFEQENPLWFGKQSVVLSLATDEVPVDDLRLALANGISQTGLDRSALSLVAIAASRYLKTSEIVYEHTLSDLKKLPAAVSLHGPPRPAPLAAGVHGAVIRVFLVLNREIGIQPLTPWRKGTWLARATFTIRTRQSSSLFRLTPLTAEIRKEKGILRRTVRYLWMGDHDPLEPHVDQDNPTFYVDDELLNLLDAHKRTPTGIALQGQLACDFLSSIVHLSAARADELRERSWEDLQGTLLGRVLRLIVNHSDNRIGRDALLTAVTQNPNKVVALAEAAIGVRRELLAALKQART